MVPWCLYGEWARMGGGDVPAPGGLPKATLQPFPQPTPRPQRGHTQVPALKEIN